MMNTVFLTKLFKSILISASPNQVFEDRYRSFSDPDIPR